LVFGFVKTLPEPNTVAILRLNTNTKYCRRRRNVIQASSHNFVLRSSQAAAANAAENAQIRQLSNARANDAQALRDDIRKMRALVGQMETNLAFVDNTQSALKHQFQLDIDMWNLVISQMERRSYSNSR
jgi:hypothetical protein